MSTERRTHVTPLWPGSFFPEEGRSRLVPNDTPDEAILAEFSGESGWFALEVETRLWEKWSTDDGRTKWEPAVGQRQKHRIYIGEVLGADAVAALPGDHHILLANMRGNGWAQVVRTRAGNFQPLDGGDLVVKALDGPES